MTVTTCITTNAAPLTTRPTDCLIIEADILLISQRGPDPSMVSLTSVVNLVIMLARACPVPFYVWSIYK